MRKSFFAFALFALVVLSCSSFAAQEGIHEPGTGIESPDTKAAAQGTGQGIDNGSAMVQAQQGSTVMAQNQAMVQEKVQLKEQQMNQELQQMKSPQKEVYQNQNQVRSAVHALLAMENMTGGIGQQVSAIARNFNNSVQSTIRAEEKIMSKSGFSRFFSGGDEEAAEELEAEVGANKLRIQQLKQLKEECDCGEEVKAMFQEQIQSMEQEQLRLEQLAKKEKASKGIFGWMWK